MDVHMYVHMYMDKGLGEEGSHGEHEKAIKTFTKNVHFGPISEREKSPPCLKCCNPPSHS